MHLLRTLAQVPQNNWSTVIEAFVVFVDLEGRVMPQPSQGLLYLFFAHERPTPIKLNSVHSRLKENNLFL